MLDSVRGLAALWVVLFHLSLLYEAPSNSLMRLGWDNLLGRGLLGVPVFFVLSGFVIAHSLRHGFAGSITVENFLLRRIIRLTPPYWAAIALALATHALAARVNGEQYLPGGSELTTGRLAAHLLYVQELAGYVHINDVFWTLSLEMQFYLAAVLVVVGLSAARTRIGDQAHVAVATTIGLASLVGPLVPGEGRAVTFVPVFYSFIFGMMAYWVYRRQLAVVSLAVLLVPFVVVGWFHRDRQFVYAAVLATVFLVIACRADALDRWLCRRPMRWLGVISYSLYLAHVPVQGAVVAAAAAALGDGPAASAAGALASLVAVVALSVVFWYLFERPAVAWSRKLHRREPPMAASTTVIS